MNNENTVAKTLSTIGIIIFLGGIVLSIVAAQNSMAYTDEFNWLAVVPAAAGFVTCILFVGFSEIIRLLQTSVNNQTYIMEELQMIQKKQEDGEQ